MKRKPIWRKKTKTRKLLAIPFSIMGAFALMGKARARTAARTAIKALTQWYDGHRRRLPWREEPTPYRVWVSEIMLQQTQVSTVIPFFERFITQFPSVIDLAHAKEQDVLRYWAGLGYYSRARNLHRAACEIAAKGVFPHSRDEWLKLPGIGPYTAGAIVSIAFGGHEPVVDGNVERVLARVLGSFEPTGPALKRLAWRVARQALGIAIRLGRSPGDFNQALMELGAVICTPRAPRCGRCPVQDFCKSFRRGDQEDLPIRAPKKPIIKLREYVDCVVLQNREALFIQASANSWRAGLWDFPSALPKKILRYANELGVIRSVHVVTRHRITRETRIWVLSGKAPKLSQEFKWGDPGAGEFPVGAPVRRTWPRVLALLP